MWKLFNKLFYWDYIYWTNSCTQGIARIHRDGSGNPYYFRHKVTNVIDRIRCEEQVVWLTCEPEKYLKDKKCK